MTLAHDGSGTLTFSLTTNYKLGQEARVNRDAVPLPSNDQDQDICIVFINGTTSLPKASVSSYRNFLAAAIAYKTYRHLDSRSVSLQHVPVFHAWSICNSIAFWLAGGTVVYPSRCFDARATLSVIESARCTHMIAVPSMIQTMAAHPMLHTRSLHFIEMVDLAGYDDPAGDHENLHGRAWGTACCHNVRNDGRKPYHRVEYFSRKA